MAKLSKTQQEVLETAKRDINKARTLDYPEWLKEINHFYAGNTEYQKKCYKEALEREEMKRYWENERNAIVFTHCSSHTIRALERMGLIEIIEDSVETGGSIDVVKILNY